MDNFFYRQQCSHVNHFWAGVPQGTATLFLNQTSRAYVYVEDCLIYRIINSPGEHQLLQENLNTCTTMKFNIGIILTTQMFKTSLGQA